MENSQDNYVTLDLQSVLTPIAILIAAFMISASIIFSVKNLQKSGIQTTGSTTTTTTTGTTTTGTTGTTTATGVDRFEAATAKIGDSPVLGKRDGAKIAIVEFTDYQCPYCLRYFQNTYDAVKKEFIDTGKAIYVYKNLPLTSIHPMAQTAAIGAECAREQNKFVEMHDEMFKAGTTASKDAVVAAAQKTGVNMDQFNSCLDGGKYADRVAADVAMAGQVGTPTFVIGSINGDEVTGKRIEGAYPIADFQSVVALYAK